MNRKDIGFIISGMSVVFSLLYICFIYLYIPKSSLSIILWLNASNVRIYGSAIIVLLGVFMFLCLMYKMLNKRICKRRRESYSLSPTLGWGFSIIVIILSGVLFSHWLCFGQFKEKGFFTGNYNNIPFIGYLAIFLFLLIWVCVTEKKREDVSRITVYTAYLVSVLWTVLLYYVPNQFNASYTKNWCNDLSCSVPFSETIYNAVDGVPFNFSTTGLYGHYSIFFALPFKILGTNNPYAIGVMLVIVAGLSQLAVLYVINTFLPKNWLKVIFSFASILFSNYYFPACFPVRTLFSAVFCAFLTFLYTRNNDRLLTKYMILGILICSLSLVWNFENGVACTFGFAMYMFLRTIGKNKNVRSFIGSVISAALIVIISISIALIIVNLWNVIFGGELIFRAFFYPLIPNGDGNYMLDINRDNVDIGNHLWVYILILVFGSLCVSIHRIFFGCEDERIDLNLEAMVASLSIFGIIAFSYYMNEAHWGATYIVHYVIISLSAVIAFKLYKRGLLVQCSNVVSCFKRGAYIFIIGVISFYAITTINIPVVITQKVETGAYNMENVLADIESMKEVIPENTYGTGLGISIIYHILGWDNHAKYRDDTSMSSSDNVTYGKAVDELLNQKEMVISHKSFKFVEEMNKKYNYELITIFNVGGCEYGYYRRIDGE